MTTKMVPDIVIQGARTNNLKNISLRIPHNKFIVVTGISGSGKSSLVFEIIAKEGQRRYFETLPSFARQFIGKLNRPDVDEIEGLSPVIAIGQNTTGIHARSTVGTMSDIYDLLRLLFARTGQTDKDIKLSRALFSFNSELGRCKRCNGIGKEEQIDLNRLVVHPEKSIREAALAPTLPNGYIMYSQVTIDVLNEVCQVEGFNVDIPWNKLTEAQKKVILYGSAKIKIPFGKHSLESRLKWTGIKAKPREEGHYKGMIPIMTDILKRDRNANILKYVHAITCPDCNGTRLNNDALSVTVNGKSIADVATLELNTLNTWIQKNSFGVVANEIINQIKAQVDLLQDIGLGHLTLDRSAKSLRASEIQRIRFSNQILVPLSDVLYVFDEPSIGLHPEENERLIYHLKQLVNKGNTVIVVEHDLKTISSADHIIEIGPAAGVNGGEVIYNGPYNDFTHQVQLRGYSPTYRAITNLSKKRNQKITTSAESELKNCFEKPLSIRLIGCYERNFQHINIEFQLGKLNVVSGKSGVGKSSLVKGTLLKAVRKQLGIETEGILKLQSCENIDRIDKLIFIDHSPIGKTPRSNPATYLGISDHIRDVYAKLPESKVQGYTKSRFSFNNKGGRCETCQGAGKTQIGMHFLGNVDLVCGTCNGDRFNEETLKVKYKEKSIAEVYKMSIDEAILFFADQSKALLGLQVLQEIGLGYLKLGQSSTTLSGGEAQRIKIANQLQKRDTGNTLYIIIEPSIGLHHDDIGSLLKMFDRIKKKGNTIVSIEQNETIIGWSDWHIDLSAGGFDSAQPLVNNSAYLAQNDYPLVGDLKSNDDPKPNDSRFSEEIQWSLDNERNNRINDIVLNGVTTHGLKNIDVRIPKTQLTVVTGLSGSGKSSLVYDTIFAESNARFTESLSTHNRSFLQQNSEAKIKSYSGLGPAIGINRKRGNPSSRSTVGTLSGVYDAFRLLYSRIAQEEGEIFTAQHFSYNHHLGACTQCEGLGKIRLCDPNEIITSLQSSIFEGAISSNKAIQYYSDINGQFVATLREAANQNDWNISQPWYQLDPKVKEVILYGTGDTIYDVTWQYNTKSRTGTQTLSAKWLGLCNYINEEYQRKRNNKNIKVLEKLLHDVVCHTCKGSRLKSELLTTSYKNHNIQDLTQLSITSCLDLIGNDNEELDVVIAAISNVVLPSVIKSLQSMIDLGLGYLNLNRSVNTLSGGERQRVTLAGQLSSNLFGVTYVLDEPTIGLDSQQINILSNLLHEIVKKGNTVIVVEHDPTFIRSADYLIEMGPGAGKLGGEITYQGTVTGISKIYDSITNMMFKDQTATREKKQNQKGLNFGTQTASANNLKDIDVTFYAEQITAIKGVSGSGKSSLIKDVLYNSWNKGRPINCETTFGFEQFKEVIYIDQEAIPQSRLSTPLSFTNILENIKSVFSKTEYAIAQGIKKADFSYLSKKGKCSTCNGLGKQKISMDFMSDIWLTCDTCKGLRYNDAILSCKLKGHSIGDVLQMTIQEAIDFFDDKSIVKNLKILKHVGIGHLLLGQSGNTLSGGESQRLKLASNMIGTSTGATLYLFDEPSTGLHYFDILQLLDVFQSLIDRGDTVVFIEHNGTLVDAADRVITLGPGSGDDGGTILT